MRNIVDKTDIYDKLERREDNKNICKELKENKKGSPYSRYYS
jgi:hypothetical protein